MSEVRCLGTNLADGWMAVAFDLGKGYGYETMIRVLDAIVEKYIIEVDRVWKAGVAGSGQEVIFKSGHKKYDTFKKYVRLSLDEYADDIAKSADNCLF